MNQLNGCDCLVRALSIISSRIRSPIDIIADGYQSVVSPKVDGLQNSIESFQATVDITDDDSPGHNDSRVVLSQSGE